MRLKELRKNNKKTQQEIANYLNVALSTYNGYELETSEPTIDTLIKLADYYNVSLDYLVENNRKKDLGFLTDDQYETIQNFLQLTEKDQAHIAGYIEAMKIKHINETLPQKGFLVARGTGAFKIDTNKDKKGE